MALKSRVSGSVGLVVLAFLVTQCTYQTRTVEVPVPFDVDFSIPVDSTHVDASVKVNFATFLESAELDQGILLPVHIGMRDWFWGTLSIAAADSSVLDGVITVRRAASRDSASFAVISGVRAASLADSLVSFVPDPGGLQVLQAGFEQYLQARSSGAKPRLEYEFTLHGTTTSTPDFKWHIRLKMEVAGEVAGKIRG